MELLPISRFLASVAVRLLAVLLAAPLALAPSPAGAGSAAKPPVKKRATREAPRKPPPPPPLAATAEQLDAAERVFYGAHACEFAQTLDVARHPDLPGYARVSYGKASYVMKPVISSTGAVRLEDVGGRTLMVQITAKSMLLDAKAGQRLVDECISARHLEAAALAASGGASAPAAAR